MDETPYEAALRELREETGMLPDQVALLYESKNWISYDFPPEVGQERGGESRGWKSYHI